MIGVRKPFSKGLHAKNDPKTREVVKSFFAGMGIVLIDDPNKFAIDLTTEDGLIRVEVERRGNWKTGKFPFKSVHILERKEKFFKDGTAHYCIVSEDYKFIGFISAKRIQRYMTPEFLVPNPNKFVKTGEYVFDIPIKDNFEFCPI